MNFPLTVASDCRFGRLFSFIRGGKPRELRSPTFRHRPETPKTERDFGLREQEKLGVKTWSFIRADKLTVAERELEGGIVLSTNETSHLSHVRCPIHERDPSFLFCRPLFGGPRTRRVVQVSEERVVVVQRSDEGGRLPRVDRGVRTHVHVPTTVGASFFRFFLYLRHAFPGPHTKSDPGCVGKGHGLDPGTCGSDIVGSTTTDPSLPGSRRKDGLFLL